MRVKSWIVQLIGLLLLSLLVFVAVPVYMRTVPEKIARDVQADLHQNGLTWAKVSAEGRNITLHGNTIDLAAHQKALQLTRSRWFVKRVHDEITPKITSPYTMQIQWNGKDLAMTGYMSSDASKEALQKDINQHFTPQHVKYTLATAIGAPEGWDALNQTIAKQVKTLQLASVHAIDQQVSITGKSTTSTEINAFKKAIKPFQAQNYKVNIHIVALDNAAIVCQQEFNRLLAEDNILFETGNAVIDPRSNKLLAELADAAIFCADATIMIAGYTDDVGDDEQNQQLSEQRAKAVKGYLFNQGGVPLERLKTVGKGAAEPIASNDTETGRAKNRRIEFNVEGI